MVMKFRATVMKVGNSLVLVLPKSVCNGFGIVKGQVLDLIVRDDGISIPIEENPVETPFEAAIGKQVSTKESGKPQVQKASKVKAK